LASFLVFMSRTISPGAPTSASRHASLKTLRVVAVGDVLLGSMTPDPPELPANDGVDLYIDAKDYLKGDVIFANLEGPLTDACQSVKCKKNKNEKACYEFSMPTRLGRALVHAGFNVMSTNNNHSRDCGVEGYGTTMETLDDLGVKHAGERGDVARFLVSGSTVSLIAFGFSDARNFPSVLDINDARRLIENLRQKSDRIIVSFHGGAEGKAAMHLPGTMEMFERTKRGDLRAFAHAVVEAGADLVIGHGPHVPRAMELYRGRLIAYSLGNFQTYGKMNLAGPNAQAPLLIVDLDLASGLFIKGRIVSFIQQEPGIPILDAQHRAATTINDLTRRDIPHGRLVISDTGEIEPAR
ncbi:MAG: CapA family protein, partial [Elusimicrobiota bacterium]